MRSVASRLLLVALLALASVLGYGLWLRWQPRGYAEALAELLDGDADRHDRLQCVAIVRDGAVARARAGDTDASVIAAMAAIELEDEPGWAAAVQLAQGRCVYLPGAGPAPAAPAAELLERASLGAPYLRSLMLAWAAERGGNRAEAARRFGQTRRSAQLFGVALAVGLADAGLQRTR